MVHGGKLSLAYTMLNLQLYLQARLYQPLYSRILLPIMQFILFGFAAYVSYTRVSDYKHHWSDVLVGAAIGSTIGIFTVRKIYMQLKKFL